MSIPVTCPECGAINKVNDSMAGRRVRCPQCDTAVHVPEFEAAAISPPPLPTDSLRATSRAGLRMRRAKRPRKTARARLRQRAPRPHMCRPSPLRLPSRVLPPSGVTAQGKVTGADDEEEPFSLASQREEEEMDMTPMVDVTFLLLIFFMVTAAFSLQKSIKMPSVNKRMLPVPRWWKTEEEQMETVEVQIDERGSFLVHGTRLGTRDSRQTELDHRAQTGNRRCRHHAAGHQSARTMQTSVSR